MKPLLTFASELRIAILVLLLSVSNLVAAQACLRAASFSQEEMMDNPIVQAAAHELFFTAHFGFDQLERAMWVTFKNGEFGFVRWPYTGNTNRSFWKGALPDCTVANVHTHATTMDEQPAFMDHQLADGNQLHGVTLPVYVLHRNGIWKALPGNRQAVKVRESGWVREFTPKMAQLKKR